MRRRTGLLLIAVPLLVIAGCTGASRPDAATRVVVRAGGHTLDAQRAVAVGAVSLPALATSSGASIPIPMWKVAPDLPIGGGIDGTSYWVTYASVDNPASQYSATFPLPSASSAALLSVERRHRLGHLRYAPRIRGKVVASRAVAGVDAGTVALTGDVPSYEDALILDRIGLVDAAGFAALNKAVNNAWVDVHSLGSADSSGVSVQVGLSGDNTGVSFSLKLSDGHGEGFVWGPHDPNHAFWFRSASGRLMAGLVSNALVGHVQLVADGKVIVDAAPIADSFNPGLRIFMAQVPASAATASLVPDAGSAVPFDPATVMQTYWSF